MRKATQQSWRTSRGLCQGKNSPSELGGRGIKREREIVEKRKMSVKVKRKGRQAGSRKQQCRWKESGSLWRKERGEREHDFPLIRVESFGERGGWRVRWRPQKDSHLLPPQQISNESQGIDQRMFLLSDSRY